MKVKMEEHGAIKRSISVDLDHPEMEKSISKVYREVQKEMKVPGFREGKVPLSLVETRLGEDLNKEIAKQVMEDTFAEAVVEAGITPISAPHFEPGKYSKGNQFSYKATFEVYPKLEIKEYEGLKLECEKVVVDDDDVDKELKIIQARLTQLEPADDSKVEEGTVTLIAYNGTIKDKKIGDKESQTVVDVGTGNVLPEFEKQIIGMSKGEKKTIKLESEQALLDVEIKEIRKKIVPPIDAELAKSVGNYNTIDDLKKDLKKAIKEAKEYWKKQGLYRQAMEKLVEKFNIDVPETFIKDELLNMYQSYIDDLTEKGMKAEDGEKPADFIVKNEASAKSRVASFMILKEISDEQKISVLDDELKNNIEAYAKESNQPVEKVNREGIASRLLFEKTLDFVISKAKIHETEPKETVKGKKKAKKE